MKHLYLIGGTMGAGKTATCRALQKMLDNCVFLDGDWCWDSHPFLVTDATKAVVFDNICHLLRNFLACPDYDHVVFCWVMHERSILDSLLDRLQADVSACAVHRISLVLTPEALEARLRRDVEAGLREEEVIARSVARLPLYTAEALGTRLIDVSHITPEEAARLILAGD